MREIKFRGWDTEKNKMFYFDLLKYMGYAEYAQEELIPSSATDHLMQFIGLKDKNGVDIYEGDIVKVNILAPINNSPVPLPEHRDNCTGAVEYKAGAWYYNFNHYLPGVAAYCEVIGNIYENSELLNNK